MDSTNPQPPPDEQTTILHLNRFVPTKPNEPALASPAEDSPTMIIRKAAEKTVAESSQPMVAAKASALPPQQMLGAIAYCYAKGIYRSEDIERKMMKDPEFRAAVGNEVPGARAIRSFRRFNRQAILHTLARFFRWRRAQSASVAGTTAGESRPVQENTQFFVKTEAADTLDKAAWVDNMAKDD
jgi:hypothetical protein